MFAYLSSFTIVHMGKYEPNCKDYLNVHFMYGFNATHNFYLISMVFQLIL